MKAINKYIIGRLRYFIVHTIPVYCIVLAFVCSIFSGCSERSHSPSFSQDNFLDLYNFETPNNIFSLPDELMEISGLSTFANGDLAAIQDELGFIYKIDPNTGKVLDKIKFHKKGDYEGVEIVGNSAFVLRSDGELYEVKNLGEKNQEYIKIELFDNKDYDIEGLGFDANQQNLLIAFKSYNKHQKTVFAYNLKTRFLGKLPVLTLDSHRLMQDLKQIGINVTEEFSPSGIAVHPVTQYRYITSADPCLLLIINVGGQIVKAIELDTDLFRQLEGITFDSQGSLYLATEGKGKTAKIVKYKIK